MSEEVCSAVRLWCGVVTDVSLAGICVVVLLMLLCAFIADMFGGGK